MGNGGFWRRQPRDPRGRWVEMDGGLFGSGFFRQPKYATFYHNTTPSNARKIVAQQRMVSKQHLQPRGFKEAGGRNTVWLHDSPLSKDMADVYGRSVVEVKVKRPRGGVRQAYTGLMGNDFDYWASVDKSAVVGAKLVGTWDKPGKRAVQRPKDVMNLDIKGHQGVKVRSGRIGSRVNRFEHKMQAITLKNNNLNQNFYWDPSKHGVKNFRRA